MTQAVPATVRCTVRAPACTSTLVRMGDVGRGVSIFSSRVGGDQKGWKDMERPFLEVDRSQFQYVPIRNSHVFFFPVPAFLDFFWGILHHREAMMEISGCNGCVQNVNLHSAHLSPSEALLNSFRRRGNVYSKGLGGDHRRWL